MMLLAAITLALTGAAPQDATARVDHNPPAYWKGDEGWRVIAYPDEAMCDIGFPTASGEYVTVGYHPTDRAVILTVTNKHATSLRAGQNKQLAVAFGTAPGRRFSQVHMLNFEVVQADEQLALSAQDTYPTFLEDFARSGVMAVLTPEGNVVSAILLTGSGEATRQLRACAMSAARLDPKDPFLPNN